MYAISARSSRFIPTRPNNASLLLCLLFWLAGCSTQITRQDGFSPEEIDKMDRLITVVVERLDVAQDVAKSKWNTKKPIQDPARDLTVIDAFVSKAAKRKLNPALTKDFISAQIEASKMIQYQLHRGWSQQHQTSFNPAPDLLKDIRPLLDRISPQLLDALDEVAPLRGNPSFFAVLCQRAKVLFPDYAYPAALALALQPLRPY